LPLDRQNLAAEYLDEHFHAFKKGKPLIYKRQNKLAQSVLIQL